MKKSWETIRNYFPIFGFVIVVVFFSIATKGAILSGTSLQSLLNQAIATALVSIGSVFVFGCGCFDMSMGGTLCMTAVLGGYAGIASGSIFVMALACLATALVLSLLKGLFAAYVEVPLFIVTIVLGFVLSALVLVIMGTETTILLNDAVKPIPSFNFTQMSAINIVALDEKGNRSITWSLIGAMPVGYELSPMDSSQSAIMTETLEFTITGFKRITQPPAQGSQQ